MCQFHILSCSSFQSWILRSETLFGTIEYSFPYLYLKFENKKKDTDLLFLIQWNQCGILEIFPSTCLSIGSTSILSNPWDKNKTLVLSTFMPCDWWAHHPPNQPALSTCFWGVGPAWHSVWARRCHYSRFWFLRGHWLRGVGIFFGWRTREPGPNSPHQQVNYFRLPSQRIWLLWVQVTCSCPSKVY